MKRNILIIIALLMIVPSLFSRQPDITGSWLGKINAGGVQLRIIFNIKINDKGEYIATMDSPDQAVRGIPMDEVTFSADSLIISSSSLRGEYNAQMVSDKSLKGIWVQAGIKYDLDLIKQTEPFAIQRPQEPKPPYPYHEENITFPSVSGKFTLAGTLSLPYGDGPFPSVILVSGSGSQNRDEEISGHKPFKVIADHLTRGGIAVLRYDDRGVGESGGNPAGATTADLTGDARSAIEYLLSREETGNNSIGIIGHSEGGLIAMKLAAGNEDIAFIVSLAGPGLKGRTILEDQTAYISRLNNVPEEIIKQSMQINNIIYDLIEKYDDPGKGIDAIHSSVRDFYQAEGKGEEIINQILENISRTINTSSYPWLRYFIQSDPDEYFPDIYCPVLALNGEKDCQVIAESNINAIVSRLESYGNSDVTGVILPGLNHLFQSAETGLPDEYGKIEQTISPAVTVLILNWIRERVY